MKQFPLISFLSSPFKFPKIRFYIGKVKIGTPYFLPRRWVKNTEKPGYMKAVPKRFGFDFVRLGWKTKWTSTDYRFEWDPLFSFVFFRWQIAVIITPEHPDHYWTSWLYYERNTDKTKSKRERIEQCRKEFPQTWTVYKNGEEKTVDYYTHILKKCYL